MQPFAWFDKFGTPADGPDGITNILVSPAKLVPKNRGKLCQNGGRGDKQNFPSPRHLKNKKRLPAKKQS
jgi:hypothetical protein